MGELTEKHIDHVVRLIAAQRDEARIKIILRDTFYPEFRDCWDTTDDGRMGKMKSAEHSERALQIRDLALGKPDYHTQLADALDELMRVYRSKDPSHG